MVFGDPDGVKMEEDPSDVRLTKYLFTYTPKNISESPTTRSFSCLIGTTAVQHHYMLRGDIGWPRYAANSTTKSRKRRVIRHSTVPHKAMSTSYFTRNLKGLWSSSVFMEMLVECAMAWILRRVGESVLNVYKSCSNLWHDLVSISYSPTNTIMYQPYRSKKKIWIGYA